MMLFSIRCINPGEPLLLLSTEIENRVFKKQEKMYYPRFTKAIIHHFLIQDKTLSWRNKIGMHTSKDDYLISTLRFVSANESTQIYGAILLECLTSPAMKESEAYKTYLGYATCDVPPMIARKFNKSSPSKKDSDLVPVNEEPVTKGKRIKRTIKKSLTKPATGIVIREPLVETMSKRKEKVYVTHGKGIELLSKVDLTEEARMKEITLLVTSEGTGNKPGVHDESNESESDSWGNDEDDSNDENDSKNEGKDEENKSDDDKTPSDSKKGLDSEQDSDGSELDSESDQQEYDDEVKDDDEQDDDDDKFEGNRGMDSDDVHDKKTDVEMTDAQHETKILKITQDQVVEDAHVTITTVAKETEVPNASGSHSSDLASKFLKFSDIPPNDAEIVSLMDVHVHHEVPRIHTSTLLTVQVLVIPEASPACTTILQSSQTFTSPPLQTTPTQPPTIKTTTFHLQFLISLQSFDSMTESLLWKKMNQLPQILPKEVSNFALPVIKTMITESLNQVNLTKASSQPQSTHEVADTLTEFELKKILIDKMNSSESYLTAPKHRECYDGLIKSYNLYKDFFSSYEVYLLKRS
nr:hypothetical protein [Tanacetum cinerariifolium]